MKAFEIDERIYVQHPVQLFSSVVSDQGSMYYSGAQAFSSDLSFLLKTPVVFTAYGAVKNLASFEKFLGRATLLRCPQALHSYSALRTSKTV